ncbi:hypothetical protein [Arenibaculum pallidiluteum]|uniref:hypothetical protein n=1 Tax=Arenibaculum pallidiluteum TaxID=2812559 RepID=UPI001A96B97C|nr:hypothetical protein [Arenibaculum pallidiluteum]
MALAHNKDTATKFKNAIALTEGGAERSFAFGRLGESALSVVAVDKGRPSAVASLLKSMPYEGPNPPKKPRFQLVTLGTVRLDGTVLVLDCQKQVGESTLKKGFQEYFRTQFRLSVPWTEVTVQVSSAEDGEPVEEARDEASEPGASSDEGAAESAGGGEDPSHGDVDAAAIATATAAAPIDGAFRPAEPGAPEAPRQDMPEDLPGKDRPDDVKRLAEQVARMARSIAMLDIPSSEDIEARCSAILENLPFERVLLALAYPSNLAAFLGRGPLPRNAIKGERIRKDETGRRDTVDALVALGDRVARARGLLPDGRILDREQIGRYVDKVWEVASDEDLNDGIGNLFKTLSGAFESSAFVQRFSIEGTAATEAPSAREALAGWRDAREAALQQVMALKKAILEDLSVPYIAWSKVDARLESELAEDTFATLLDADAAVDATERDEAVARLREIVRGKREWLGGGLADDLDTAPFETAEPVAIRETIAAALLRIEAVLDAA